MEQRKGPRRSKIEPSVKRLIFQEAIRHRDIPRQLLANRLVKEIREARERPPTPEVTMRYISKARNTDNPVDKPWSLGACRDYPTFFPPSSLPTLVKMQEEHKKFINIMTNTRSPGLSIRTCIWIARLEPIIHDLWHEEHDTERERNILVNLATAYSLAERTSETMGQQAFDTNDLDEALSTKDPAMLYVFGAASRDPNFVCNGNCDSCKYEPVVPGKLCQLRGLEPGDEFPEHYLIRKPPTQRNKKGE